MFIPDFETSHDETDEHEGSRRQGHDQSRLIGRTEDRDTKEGTVAEDFTDEGNEEHSNGEANAHAHAVEEGNDDAVFRCNRFSTSQDDSKYDDQVETTKENYSQRIDNTTQQFNQNITELQQNLRELYQTAKQNAQQRRATQFADVKALYSRGVAAIDAMQQS